MTKAELVANLNKQFGLTKKDIATVVDATFAQIKENILKGEDVKISGFGNFIVHERGARVGRILLTGERKDIPKRRVVAFRPSAKLKNKVNE
jgi:integration host factor subunit alpha